MRRAAPGRTAASARQGPQAFEHRDDCEGHDVPVDDSLPRQRQRVIRIPVRRCHALHQFPLVVREAQGALAQFIFAVVPEAHARQVARERELGLRPSLARDPLSLLSHRIQLAATKHMGG